MYSDRFDLIKSYYPRLWNKQRVWNAVDKWITAEEYEEITGEFYSK